MSETGVAAIDRNTGATTSNATVTVIAANSVEGDGNVIGENIVMPPTPREDSREFFQKWMVEHAGEQVDGKAFDLENFAPTFMHKFMAEDVFKSCLQNHSKSVLLSGSAGIGKTTLMAAIAKNIAEDDQKNCDVLTMYFSSTLKQAHRPPRVMMHLLRQLLRKDTSDIAKVRTLWDRNRERTPPAPQTTDVLIDYLKRPRPTCIIVDGIDECDSVEALNKVRGFLYKIHRETGVGIIFTDRLNKDERKWDDTFEYIYEKKMPATLEDMEWYINERIKRSDLTWLRNNERLSGEVVKEVMKASQKIFLLVRINIEYILTNSAPTTEEELNKELSIMSHISQKNPQYADHTSSWFANYLDRVIPQGSTQGQYKVRYAKQAFRFVLDAKETLTKSQLEVALLTWNELNHEIRDTKFDWASVRNHCHGLLEARYSSLDVPVRFVHSTFRDFLMDRAKDKLPPAHLDMAMVCTACLSHDAFSGAWCRDEKDVEKRYKDHPLSVYAAKRWAYHFRQAPDLEKVHKQALQFLGDDKLVESFTQLRMDDVIDLNVFERYLLSYPFLFHTSSGYETYEPHLRPRERKGYCSVEKLKDPWSRNLYTGLHVAAEFCLPSLADGLLKKMSAGRKDAMGRTALHVASASGCKDMVEILLNSKATLNARDHDGLTPFLTACIFDRTNIVELFTSNKEVDVGAKVDSEEMRRGFTALHIAADDGSISLLQYLLKQTSLDINALDNNGQTPLQIASLQDRLKHVELLCGERGRVQIAQRVGFDDHGDFQIKSRLYEGCNAIHLASIAKSAPMLKFLIEDQPAKVLNQQDSRGLTPLFWAVQSGFLEGVKLLVAHDAVDPNIQTYSETGITPLWQAIAHRNQEIFDVLWSNSKVEKTVTEHYLRELLEHAEYSGEPEMITKIRELHYQRLTSSAHIKTSTAPSASGSSVSEKVCNDQSDTAQLHKRGTQSSLNDKKASENASLRSRLRYPWKSKGKKNEQ